MSKERYQTKLLLSVELISYKLTSSLANHILYLQWVDHCVMSCQRWCSILLTRVNFEGKKNTKCIYEIERMFILWDNIFLIDARKWRRRENILMGRVYKILLCVYMYNNCYIRTHIQNLFYIISKCIRMYKIQTREKSKSKLHLIYKG